MIGTRFRLARRTLPLGPDAALYLLPWVFALFVYIAGLAGIGLLVVSDTLRASADSLSSRLTVQIPAGASDARLQTVLAALRQTPGIRSAEPLTQAETARLLEPWLGSPVPIEELPVPRLIDVSIDPDAAIDLAKLRQQLTAIVPDARLDDQRAVPGGLRVASRPLCATLGALVVVSLLLSAVLAVFVARNALAARRQVIELLNLLGAADRDIALPFAIRSLRLALLGGAIGGGAVVLTVAVLGGVADIVRLPAPGTGPSFDDWRLWGILVGVILATGLLATASALATVRHRLTRLP